MSKRSYGWIRQEKDPRDRVFAVSRRLTANLPQSVDLSPTCAQAADQGNIGSCGPTSIDNMVRYDQKVSGLKVQDVSRLFTYWTTRYMMGTTNQDSGVDNRTMFKALAKYGIIPESLWPYNVSLYRKQPPNNCFTEGDKSLITDYAAVQQDIDQMRGVLVAGHPFLFGAEVFQAIESDAVAATGVVPMPRSNESPVGGHDVLFVGYDDRKAAFKFQMPWGPNWGLNGFGWWPYDYALNSQLASDFWAINTLPGGKPIPVPPVGDNSMLTFTSDVKAGTYDLVPVVKDTPNTAVLSGVLSGILGKILTGGASGPLAQLLEELLVKLLAGGGVAPVVSPTAVTLEKKLSWEDITSRIDPEVLQKWLDQAKEILAILSK